MSGTEDRPDEDAIRSLYQRVLNAWDARDAAAMAAEFAVSGESIGFDGTTYTSRVEIAESLAQIFRDHPTPAYVTIVKSVQFPAANVGILRAIVSMVPPGKDDLLPQLNAIQTLTATRVAGAWRVALFQNTPAQFHGRPQLVEEMNEELRAVLAKKSH